ncbi:signal peptidase I [Anaerotignum sp.]
MQESLQEWGKAILRAAIIIVVLFFFCWPMRLMGSSMEPTMGDGEIVLMNRLAAMRGDYEKGDIVMFHYYDADGSKTVVKRIIATEGDTIRILEDGVEVNGEIIQESYADGVTDGLVDMTVPQNTVFVMGDNRQNSYDSRNMGVISCDDLKGKVFFRIYPFQEFGKI